MQTDHLDAALLRRLSGLRVENGKVLSLLLDLDPHEFGTVPARESAIRSLLDEADREVRDAEGTSHDEQAGLRADVDRARAILESADFKGAQGMAVYLCTADGLEEVVKLPRPAGTGVDISDSPWVAPLAGLQSGERLCVALVTRRDARIFRGTRHELTEIEAVEDDVHQRHSQGGWSQLRYQRSVEKEVEDHYRHVAEELFRQWRVLPFDALVVGATAENHAAFVGHLHAYLEERLAGRIEVDVENAGIDDVARALEPLLEERDRERERTALDRLAEGVGRGDRGTHGVDATLGALNERRVEILLVEDGLSAPGVTCANCGWLGTGEKECPACGHSLQTRENVVEHALDAALQQSADAIVVRHHEDLGPLGRIGAVLRF